jgi:integrase
MTLKGHGNRRDRVLSAKEFQNLYDKAPEHLQDILVMGYWTGMRKGEILNLTWDKVDMKNRFIHLESSDTKEGAGKTIPIGDEVNKALNRLPRGLHTKIVFLYNGKPILNRFETAMKTACEKAKIKWGREAKDGFIFHDLRHTFVTDMRRAGVERTVTMAITGHAIQDMNQRYDNVDEKDKLQAIAKLEAYRRNAFANVDQNVDQPAI